jgi:uncharacterized lipoprotein YddW (UPF0748 family)
MKNRSFSNIVFVITAWMFVSCGGGKPSTDLFDQNLPRAEREFRGVWVATVGNIDWPSKPGLSTEEQQREALAILDTVAALNMNAIVFQVRPHCDALYASELEPWSFYLTGEQGKAPDPFYDPLEFWITESHKRGIELHAWFNPYRAHLSRGSDPTETSIVKRRPDLAKKTDGRTYWLDPAKKEVQDISYNVVMDVLRRYDVDGIHFDDYFYPYGDGNFPDDDSWEEYTKSGGKLSREDWRRGSVNTFIERVYTGIKKEKPFVKFGLSPFGIWRPGYPASITGYDQYARLYADAKLWLNKGWIDYWTPQLYWPVNQIPQSFPVLLGWWAKENTQNRNLWPGMIINRPRDEKTADEIFNQIMIARGFVPGAPGHVHFSMKAFMRDSTVMNAALLSGPYQKQALIPPSPWLDRTPPAAPAVTIDSSGDPLVVNWTSVDADAAWSVLYFRFNLQWQYTVLGKGATTFSVPRTRSVQIPRSRDGGDSVRVRIDTLTDVAVSAVDRTGNESEIKTFSIPAMAAPDSLPSPSGVME